MPDDPHARSANAATDPRSMVAINDGRRRRRRCPYRCRNRTTHTGTANGLGMMSGCEWHVRRWVKWGRA